MDLFTHNLTNIIEREAPLAYRMRPKSFDEYQGQEHIIGAGKILRRAIENDLLYSIILWGAPGIGKTALASVIANTTNSSFRDLNAVTAKIADLRQIILEAAELRSQQGKRTVLFLDEIHRFNKAQQDALLPDVEKGIITLIGATTQNPYFSVISALVSRSQIFELKPLGHDQLDNIINLTLRDAERGLGKYPIILTPKARTSLIEKCNGDARRLLNGLEISALTSPTNQNGKIEVTYETVMEAMQKRSITYDEDQHYDVISAFIKSMRGSDPDASVYWLAVMLKAGEDPAFIARRIIICAAEDVGLADPQALILASAALQASEFVGMPEARIPLAEAAIYVARAPKSNSAYTAIDQALGDLENNEILPVPDHLRDPHRPGAPKGKYLYPHDFPDGKVEQDYLGAKKTFYYPTERDV